MSDAKKLSEQVVKILETPFWLEGVDTNEIYQLLDDDAQGHAIVIFGCDGDAHLNTYTKPITASVRVRTYAGGGKNHRTRTALMILALAIKMDKAGQRSYGEQEPT